MIKQFPDVAAISTKRGAVGALTDSARLPENLVRLADRRAPCQNAKELNQMKRQSVYPFTNTEAPGATIHELRQQREWSVRDLSDKTGLDHSTISRIENNGGYTKDSLERIAAAFGCTTVNLFLPASIASLALLSENQQNAIAEQIAALAQAKR